MRHNRRDSPMGRCWIGEACLGLLVHSLIIVTSIVKVIVGSGYVSSCPFSPDLPVYVIVSGCLPVLLSVLRHSSLKSCQDVKSTRLVIVMATVGVLINFAWLVVGTTMVTKTWTEPPSAPPFVCTDENSISGPHNISSVANSTSGTEALGNSTLTDTLVGRKNVEFTLSPEAEKVNTSSYPTYNNTDILNDFNTSKSVDVIKKCKLCANVILTFSLVSVCIDWTAVIILIVYGFLFCRSKTEDMKEVFFLNSL